jgi:SSS family solute:Na+ symporter
LVIRVATGGAVNGTISSAIAFLLVIAFVLWSGLHGVARTSYFKDALMIIIRAVVVIVGLAALVLALVMPGLLANMLLLSFSGSAQVIPAIAGTLLLKRQLDRASVIAGLCAGSIIVIVFTFWPLSGLDINAGISGLAVNIAVIAVVEFLVRGRRAALPARMRSEAAVRS